MTVHAYMYFGRPVVKNNDDTSRNAGFGKPCRHFEVTPDIRAGRHDVVAIAQRRKRRQVVVAARGRRQFAGTER